MNIADPPPCPLVAASILASDFARVAEDCRDVLAKGADLLHLDVMDGHFVSNLTMGPDMCRALRAHFPKAYLDVHLMVEKPGMFLEAFAEAGASLVSFHAEVCRPHRDGGEEAEELVERAHKLGMQAGMVVNPPTPAEHLEPYLGDLDLVLVMSVHPGRGGQKFMPEVLDKTRWLGERIGPGTRLEMDGGIDPDTAPRAAAAGVDVLVSGSALFGAKDRAGVIERLHASRGAG